MLVRNPPPPLIPDADGVYIVASSDIAKGATLTVEASSSLGNVGTVLGGVLGGGSEVSASKDVTVTATKDAADQALVYYLLDPTKDANSNDSGHWGKTSLGTAMVNTTGATWAGGKNCFDNVDQRVVSWPNGTNVVPRDSDAWNEIFDNYKTTIQAQLPGVTFTKDDVEEIALVPAKISKNNGTDPDMHLDCNVSIKCKNVALVKYYLRDAGSTQFEQKGARNYISGNATQPSDVMNEQFPETKTVDGVTYTFSGWYLDRSFTQPATFPYTVNSSTSFYAKYVGGFRVAYDLAGGSWNNSDATTYIAQEGSMQTVKSEPTREGYKFTGWTIEGLPDTTALKSGDTFTMPAGNVTITANWQELLSYQVKYLEKGTESQLEDPITQYGEQGHEVSADAKTIDGYHLVEGCPKRITKTLGSSDNDITFWYEKDSVEYAVNYYLNGTEQKVAKSETKSAPWDTQVKASDLAKGIDGYTAVPNQATTITVNRDGKSYINVYYYQNVDLVANSDAKTYNGSEQSASGFTGAPEDADFSGITVGANGTDAGTYPAQFAEGTVGTIDKTEKYIVASVENGSLVIGKAEVTLKSADLSKKYDGTALKNGDNALETESGFVEGEGATYAFTGSQTVVGSSPNAFDYTLNEGTKADNYTITKSEGTLTVTNRDAKYEIEVESNSAEFTYNGNEHMAEGFKTLEFPVDGNEYTVSGLSASVARTDAGTYSNAITGTAKVVDASGNDVSDQFSVTTKNGSLVIKQASVHMKSASDEWVYDGNEHAKHEMESVTGFAKDEGATYSYTGAITNAGTVQNMFTYTLNEGTKASNYTFDDPEYGTLKVTPVSDEVTVTIKGNTATETYDGTEKTVRDYGFEASNDLYGTGDFVFTGAAVAKGTNVGTYKMGLDKGQFSNTSANFSNVTFVVEDGWLKIEGGQIDANDVTWTTQDVQKVYDGNPLSAFPASATDTHGNELNVEYSIDGEAWTSDPAKISLTHFGSQKVLLRATGSNYAAGQYATRSENIAINKRPVTLTSAGANKVYDGKPLTNDTVTSTPLGVDVGFLDGEGVTCNVTGSQTNVGESDNEFTYTFNEGTSKSDYLVTYEFGKLIVTQDDTEVVVTITEHSGTFEYDGTQKTVSGYDFSASNELYKNTDFEFAGNDSVSATNVGTYGMELKSEDFKNTNGNFSKVTFVVVDGQLTITPKSVDPEAGKGMSVGKLPHVTYNGESQKQKPEVKDGNALLTEGTDYTLVYSKDTTNVGTVTVTVEGKGNYAGEAEVTYEILKRQVTLESASASKVYDGTPLTKPEVTVGGDGFVEGEVSGLKAIGTVTNVADGEVDNEIVWDWAEGFGEGNYGITKTEGKLSIEPQSVDPDNPESYTGIKVGELSDLLYKGKDQFQEPTVTDAKGNLLVKDRDYTLAFDGDAKNVTEAGVSVTVSGIGNYTGSADVAYQILPAKLIVTTPSDSMVYNGKPLTAEGSIEGFVNNETAVFETTGSQTEVGESENAYAIYWSDEGTTAKRSNYTVEEHIGTLTVTEYADEIVAVANDVTMTYDGMPHRAEVTVTGVPEGYSVKTAWSGAEATDVTGADGLVANVDEIVVVNAEGKDVTNSLKIIKKPGKLVIEPKELTVVTMGASKPYDGTPLTANGKIEGFVNGETAAFAVIGSQTEVGECTNAYTIEWSGNAKQGNYTVKEELGKLEVTKSQAAIVIVPKGGKKTYDGTPLVSEGADAYGLPAGFTCEATTKGSVTNVGSAVAEIDTYAIKNADGKDVTDQFGNVSTGFATLLVTKRPVTVVSEDASKVYDGTPLTKHEAGVTEGSMVDGESFVYEFTGTQTVAGESANSFIISAGDGTNLDNYEITKQEGTLKVEPKGIVPGEDNGMKVTKPVDKVYNGKEQKFVPVVTDGDKALVENVDYVVTYTDALGFEDDAAAKDDFTNVTGDIFVTVTGIGNYAGSLTQSYQITPKPYTVTTVSGSKVYDGTPLEGASLEGNFVGGLVNDDDATFVVTGTQTEVGASDNTYTLEFVDEQMAKNYKLVKEDIGTLTVVKDESEASQNPNGNGESKNKGTLPKTSDTTLATLPFALAVVAGAVLCAAPVARRRSKF